MKLLLVLLLFIPQIASAYEPTQTHPGITEQVIEFYNLKFANKVTNSQKELIIKGSTDEDDPATRALNHFYDPIRNIGIEGGRTAKDWATIDTAANDNSWDEALSAYARGDTNTAFIALGHVLHLVEDMGVPDHTRNDQHLPFLSSNMGGGSPYEEWAMNNKGRITMQGFAQGLINENIAPKQFPQLSDYFDFLANYSNKNFLSKDTIKSSVYTEPAVEYSDEKYFYGNDKLRNNMHVLFGLFQNDDGVFTFALRDKYDTSVLSSYFDRLARQMVPSGAGVIDLFFKEGEKARIAYQETLRKKQEADIQASITLANTLSQKGLLSLAISGVSFLIQDNLLFPLNNHIFTPVYQTLANATRLTAETIPVVANTGLFASVATAAATQGAAVDATNWANQKALQVVTLVQGATLGTLTAFAGNGTQPVPQVVHTLNDQTADTLPETQGSQIPTPDLASNQNVLLTSLDSSVVNSVTLGGGGGTPPAPLVSLAENKTSSSVNETSATTTVQTATSTTPSEPPAPQALFSRAYIGENVQLGAATNFYQYYFKGYRALGNPVDAPNYWVATDDFDKVRIKKVSGTASCATIGTSAGFADETGNIVATLVSGTANGDFCEYGVSGGVIRKDLHLSSLFFPEMRSGAFVLDGSSMNEGRSVDGYNSNDTPGGFAFELCRAGDCIGTFSIAPDGATPTTSSGMVTPQAFTTLSGVYSNHVGFTKIIIELEDLSLASPIKTIEFAIPATDTVAAPYHKEVSLENEGNWRYRARLDGSATTPATPWSSWATFTFKSNPALSRNVIGEDISLGTSSGFYVYYFMGYGALGSPVQAPNYWVATDTIEKVRVKKVSGTASCADIGTAAGFVDEKGNSVSELSGGTPVNNYCEYGLSGSGIKKGTHVSALYFAVSNKGTFVLDGSSANVGRSVNGFGNADTPGGFAFSLCAAGNCLNDFSTPPGWVPPVDTTPLVTPTITVAQCSASLASDSCLLATTSVRFAWNAVPDALYYAIDKNGNYATTTEITLDILTPDFSDYTFSISAKGANGRTSATTTKIVSVSTLPLVINEIAWMGTASSTADEWIELFNTTNSTISISGWEIRAVDGAPVILLSGNILPKAYYLIERTDDTTIADIVADLIAPFSGNGGSGLSNNGEKLELYHGTEKIDETPDVLSGWVAGENGVTIDGKRTMERINPASRGIDATNWGTNTGNIKNGTDKGGNPIWGTPRAKNSLTL